MIFGDLAEQYPHFVRVATHLEQVSGLFMSRNLMQLKKSQPDYAFAEKLCSDAYELCGRNDERFLERARSMVDFSMEFVYLQRKLNETGRYLYQTFEEVEKNVYNDPGRALKGAPYIWALYFTQVFWITHGRVWEFFLRHFVGAGRHGRVLEVPSGNGLFLTHFLLNDAEWRGVAVDLSDTSIHFTDEMLRLNGVRERSEVRQQDFFDLDPDVKFDRIICGEFLEHVEDPQRVLARLHELLDSEGRLFLSAAVWAANIDHIFLYKSADEVRAHLREAHFAIERELVQPVLANDDPEAEKVPVNYSAILRRA